MSTEKTKKVSRLKVLDVLRLNNGLTFTEVMRGAGLSGVTVRAHLRFFTDTRRKYVSRESRKYFLTKKGEEHARFLERIIQGSSWGKNVSIPQIVVMAVVGFPTCTLIGCSGNSIKNVYENLKNFVESAKNEGFVFFWHVKGVLSQKSRLVNTQIPGILKGILSIFWKAKLFIFM